MGVPFTTRASVVDIPVVHQPKQLHLLAKIKGKSQWSESTRKAFLLLSNFRDALPRFSCLLLLRPLLDPRSSSDITLVVSTLLENWSRGGLKYRIRSSTTQNCQMKPSTSHGLLPLESSQLEAWQVDYFLDGWQVCWRNCWFLTAYWFEDKIGRKGALLINNIFAFVAAALMSLAKFVGVYYLLIVGRLVIGKNV